MRLNTSKTALIAGACAAALVAATAGGLQAQQAGAAPQGAPPAGAQAGRAGGGGGGRGGPQTQVASVTDVMQMMAALPATAPATPKQPRRVLVLGKAGGFVHSSIPLATRTIEALGQKTGAWTTVISFNPADINTANLAQYDAIFLASTTGTFLDDPNDAAATTARRQALLDFVRGGKGIAGIHAATDAYHGRVGGAAGAPPAAPPAAAGATPAGAGAGGRAGAPGAGAARGPSDGGVALWPDYIKLIGGYFKFHWNYPTQIQVKIEDPNNPINAPFTTVNQQGVRTGRGFAIVDEVYTFNQDSWTRNNARVLTSLDYDRMPAEVKAQEPAPQRNDQDYALSYIRKEGQGRVFVQVLGHDESIYKMTPMLAHILAGMQYALGDLQADDTPSGPKKP